MRRTSVWVLMTVAIVLVAGYATAAGPTHGSPPPDANTMALYRFSRQIPGPSLVHGPGTVLNGPQMNQETDHSGNNLTLGMNIPSGAQVFYERSLLGSAIQLSWGGPNDPTLLRSPPNLVPLGAITDQMTVEVTFRPVSALSTGKRLLVGQPAGDWAVRIVGYNTSETGVIELQFDIVRPGYGAITTFAPLDPKGGDDDTRNESHYAACVYDGQASQARIYLDGKLVASKTHAGLVGSLNLPAFQFRVGSAGEAGDNAVRANLDEIRISNIVRSEVELGVPGAGGLDEGDVLALIADHDGDCLAHECIRAQVASGDAANATAISSLTAAFNTHTHPHTHDDLAGDIADLEAAFAAHGHPHVHDKGSGARLTGPVIE